MRIYGYIQTTGYEILRPIDSDGFDRFDRVNGKPQYKKWKPIRVERIRATRREGGRPSDAPFMFSSGVMVFRRSAVDALRDILDAHGELLPLEDTEGVELYAYNPRALDALDHALTRGSRDARGLISLPYHHVFFPLVVEGVDIFRLKREKAGAIYVSEQFVARWKQAKLKGLDFMLAWDSELPPDKQPNVWESKPVKL
jgi:hypothetical protein